MPSMKLIILSLQCFLVKHRTKEPLHAVLEAELGENGMDDGLEGQSIRNHALIHYLATLANSNNTNDTFDFDFVESLLNNGADVNSVDKTGQTIFHEVAKYWNTDVVIFLLKHGNYIFLTRYIYIYISSYYIDARVLLENNQWHIFHIHSLVLFSLL